MNFNFFKKKKELADHEKVWEEHKQLKKDIQKKLDKLGLSYKEVLEVTSIIDKTQDQIKKLKDSLVGTNIDQDPTEITEKTLNQIHQLTLQMPTLMSQKVEEILNRKNRF